MHAPGDNVYVFPLFLSSLRVIIKLIASTIKQSNNGVAIRMQSADIEEDWGNILCVTGVRFILWLLCLSLE